VPGLSFPREKICVKHVKHAVKINQLLEGFNVNTTEGDSPRECSDAHPDHGNGLFRSRDLMAIQPRMIATVKAVTPLHSQ
jgi:hypothetical protein